MSELRAYLVAPILIWRDVPQFSEDRIREMLEAARVLGMDLGPTSDLADLTLAELDILVQDTKGAN